MAGQSTHGCLLMQALPAELLTEVLASIPDIPSLVSAALTCRTMYDLATNTHLDIPRRVLAKEIAPRVTRDAFTAVDARHRDGWLLSWLPNKRPVTPEDLLQGSASFPQHWNLRTCTAMSSLHSKVRDLAIRFARTALGGRPTRLKTTPLSDLEICRIEMAFYRVEIYSALYEIQPVHYHWQRNLSRNFFRQYAPWEIEQFTCIWEWLNGRARDAIRKLATCDVGWQGYMHYKLHGEIEVRQTEFFARTGIHLMHLLMGIREDDTLPAFLLGIDPRRAHTTFFVSNVISDVHFAQGNALSPAIQYEPHPTTHRPLQRPLIPDPDIGPEQMWCWCHPPLEEYDRVFSDEKQLLRKRGYVLWDRARTSELMETPYDPQSRSIWNHLVGMLMMYERSEFRLSGEGLGSWEETSALLDRRAEEYQAEA